MKLANLLSVLILTMCLSSFSQSKFQLSPSIGVLAVGEEGGTSYAFDVSYQTSKKWNVTLSYMYGDIEFDDFETDVQSISLGGEHLFNPDSNTTLSSLFGFSYVMFNEDLNLEDDNGLGFQFGLRTTFNSQKRLNYGVNLMTTFVSNSPGGILQSNVFVRYRL